MTELSDSDGESLSSTHGGGVSGLYTATLRLQTGWMKGWIPRRKRRHTSNGWRRNITGLRSAQKSYDWRERSSVGLPLKKHPLSRGPHGPGLIKTCWRSKRQKRPSVQMSIRVSVRDFRIMATVWLWQDYKRSMIVNHNNGQWCAKDG